MKRSVTKKDAENIQHASLVSPYTQQFNHSIDNSFRKLLSILWLNTQY